VAVSALCPAAGIENEEARAARGELNVNWILYVSVRNIHNMERF